jgi:muramoyltetrapeptide carboxypeptidase LdcA involved in peptidoglycan recycling
VLAQATPFALPLECFDGAVLFWEELGGQASYVWNYLQIMRHSGILDRISGMVVGVPEAIDGLDSSEGSPTLAELVLEVLGDRDIPVLGNVEVGHAGAESADAGRYPRRPRCAAADAVAARTGGAATHGDRTGRLSNADQ